MPRSLHRELSRQAEREGVSLNQFVVYALGRTSAIGEARFRTDETIRTVEESIQVSVRGLLRHISEVASEVEGYPELERTKAELRAERAASGTKKHG